jgi:hypothetical protein
MILSWFQDDKKLIRYRDSKIVSTKGERFSQVTKEESEEMKKSYVSWLPAELRDRRAETISEQIRISNFPAIYFPELRPNWTHLPDPTRLLNFPAEISLYNRPLILPSAPLWLKTVGFLGQKFFISFSFLSFRLVLILILNSDFEPLVLDLTVSPTDEEKRFIKKKPRWSKNAKKFRSVQNCIKTDSAIGSTILPSGKGEGSVQLTSLY